HVAQGFAKLDDLLRWGDTGTGRQVLAAPLQCQHAALCGLRYGLQKGRGVVPLGGNAVKATGGAQVRCHDVCAANTAAGNKVEGKQFEHPATVSIWCIKWADSLADRTLPYWVLADC